MSEMKEKVLNLSPDNVKDMQTESPAKESKETVADRIPKLPKRWAGRLRRWSDVFP